MSAATCPLHATDAHFEEVGDQRHADRRANDRRAPRLKLDPLFATTLLNQIAKPERVHPNGYTAQCRAPRAGIVVNVRA